MIEQTLKNSYWPRFDQVGLAFSVTVVLFVKAFRFL